MALTRRQQSLLEHLRTRNVPGSRAPTLSELCTELGLASRGSLHKQVVALTEAGFVEPMLGKQRGVRLRRTREVAEARLPWLGRLDASGRMSALGRYESLRLPAWMGAIPEGFLLSVEGERWAHFRIHSGDLLAIAAGVEPADSDLVAIAIDDDEYLLGRIRHDGEVLLLESDAPPAPTRRIMPGRARVQGVIRGLMRRIQLG